MDGLLFLHRVPQRPHILKTSELPGTPPLAAAQQIMGIPMDVLSPFDPDEKEIEMQSTLVNPAEEQ